MSTMWKVALTLQAIALVANVFTLWQVLRIARLQRAQSQFIERIQFLK